MLIKNIYKLCGLKLLLHCVANFWLTLYKGKKMYLFYNINMQFINKNVKFQHNYIKRSSRFLTNYVRTFLEIFVLSSILINANNNNKKRKL